MRYSLRILTLTAILAALQGCSTTKDNVLLGIGIGSALGAGIASLMKVPNKNHVKTIGLGIGIGATLGGAAGYYDSKYKNQPNKTSTTEQRISVANEDDLPAVTKPIVKKVWIPDRIEDNQLTKGHYIYVIERPSVWSTDSSEGKKDKSEEARPTAPKPRLHK